ncbi:MAG: DUF1492 domain-containing protein [Subdoligranulum sp.]|nr:DUF1492 domain-containing protein [Subdoligranulum sp.]
MTRDPKKVQWLKRYGLAKAAEQRLRQRLCEVRLRSVGVSMLSSAHVQTTRGQSGVERAAEHIAKAESELAAQTERRKCLYVEIMRAIIQIQEPNQRRVLKYRYINGLTFAEISDKMDFSRKWVYRLHDKALDQIQIDGPHAGKQPEKRTKAGENGHGQRAENARKPDKT